MKLGSLMLGAVALAVLAPIGGCSYPAPGPLVYRHCPPNSHTESYPNNPDPQRAYACKSDDIGVLENRSQGDPPKN